MKTCQMKDLRIKSQLPQQREKVKQVVPGKKVGQIKHGADQYLSYNSGMREIVKQYDAH